MHRLYGWLKKYFYKSDRISHIMKWVYFVEVDYLNKNFNFFAMWNCFMKTCVMLVGQNIFTKNLPM